MVNIRRVKDVFFQVACLLVSYTPLARPALPTLAQLAVAVTDHLRHPLQHWLSIAATQRCESETLPKKHL